MRRRLLLLPVAALLALTALGALYAARSTSTPPRADTPSGGPYRGSEPPGVNYLPSFSLPRIGGGFVRSKNLRGRIVLTTFVDSECKETCPIIIGLLGRALPQLASQERGQLTALAISVNPAGDSRAHVRRFLRARGALDQLDYLVAPAKEMQPVWRGFHVLSAAATGDPNVHSADVRIFDRKGRWVSTLNAGADLTVANLLHDIRQALRS